MNDEAGPMVCDCEPTQAKPGVNLGECPGCRRKPLVLFTAAAGALLQMCCPLVPTGGWR